MSKELHQIASQVRRDIVRMVHGSQSGHPGGSLGCTDFMVALYFGIMKHNPNFDMNGLNEDLFFLSNGHLSPLFYSILARSGYFDVQELSTFRRLNSRLQGHPATHEHLPGVRIASGSLGQGLSVAIGAAITKKRNNDNSIVYSLHGAGELQEGQIWEATMFASHHKIDNLVATIDYNGQQIDGPVNEVMSLGNLHAKFEAFGWEVVKIEEGNNIIAIYKSVLNITQNILGKGKPVCILLHTQMGYGVDFMMNDHKWHGAAPTDEQLQNALEQLPETLGDY